jgi:hypothetical protein
MGWSGTRLGEGVWEPYTSETRLTKMKITHEMSIPVENQVFKVLFRDSVTKKPEYYSSFDNFFFSSDLGLMFLIHGLTKDWFEIQILVNPEKDLEYLIQLIYETPDPSLTVTTGGSVDSQGYEIEYRFDFGDGEVTLWNSVPEATHVYQSPGIYAVRSQGRAPGVESSWSEPRLVEVTSEPVYVYTPKTPVGSTELDLMYSYAFEIPGNPVTDGTVEYRFNFGDGTITDWTTSGNSSHYYVSSGKYIIRAQARVAGDDTKKSKWSDGFLITAGVVVSESVEVTETTLITTETVTPTPVFDPVVLSRTLLTVSMGLVKLGSEEEASYRFDFGDGWVSSWSSEPTLRHSWRQAGLYKISAQMRVRDITDLEAGWTEWEWSEKAVLQVRDRIVTTPTAPLGPTEVQCRTVGVRTNGDCPGEVVQTPYGYKWFGDWTRVPGLGEFQVQHGLGRYPYLIIAEFDYEGSSSDRYLEVGVEDVADKTGLDLSVRRNIQISPNIISTIFHKYLLSEVKVVQGQPDETIKKIASRYKLFMRS